MVGARYYLLAVAPSAMVAVTASAQPAQSDKSKVQVAKAYVDAGLVAQRSGDYDTAIALYKKAYELVPHPVLLFNIAQAYRLAGRIDQALKFYRKYLEEDPQGSEVATAHELLAEIEANKANEISEAKARESADNDDSDGDNDEQSSVDSDDASPDTIRPEIPARNNRDTLGSMVLARMGIGVSFSQRALTYDSRKNFLTAPQPFLTLAPAGYIEGELYPFAPSDPESLLAGFGIVAAYERSFFLTVKKQGSTEVLSFDQAHYQIGLRYRFGIGESSTVAIGIDYIRWHYLLERYTSTTGSFVDAPDVDYMAVAPTIVMHVPIEDTVAILASVDSPLVYDAGSIQKHDNYGAATVYGLEATAGVYLALEKPLSFCLAIKYSRLQLVLDGVGAMSNSRDGDPSTQDVNGIVDRSIGVTATIAMTW